MTILTRALTVIFTENIDKKTVLHRIKHTMMSSNDENSQKG